MATNPNEVGEQGWVIDPKNPSRATYTDTDGTIYEAFKPEAPAEPTTRGSWQRLKDSAVEASQYGFPGAVARKWYDWTDYGVQDLIKQGHSPEEAEAIADTMIGEAQKGLRAEMAAKQEADPNWKADDSFWENVGAIDRWGPWLAGQLVGSAGPESAVPMGKFAQYGAKTAAALRMGAAAGVNAVTGALYQGLDMIDQARDEFSVEEMLSDAAIGAGFQGAFEVPGFIKGLFKGRGTDTTPDGVPSGKKAPLDNTRMTEEDQLGWEEINQTGTFQEIRDYADRIKDEYGFDVKSSEIAAWVKGRDEAAALGNATDAYTVYQQGQTADAAPKAAVAPEFKPTERLTQERANIAVDHINTITKDWKNAPEYTVHDNFDNLEGVDNDAIGVFRDGKVDINLRQVMDEAEAQGVTADDMLSSVTFHEALGHHGLAQKFGEDLDLTLNRLYDSDNEFTKAVDQWMADNPDAYADDMDPLARAAEEVLAEMSENGRIKPNIMAMLRNWLKQMGRDMGLDLKYSDGEIRTILGMAHNAVVKGNGRDVVANGFRYMQSADNGNTVGTVQMPDGTSIEVLTDINGKILDTLNYRSPSGNMLPQEYKPSPDEVRKVLDADHEDFLQQLTDAADVPYVGDMYDDAVAVKLMKDAEDNPGKLQISRMWPGDQAIVDFRYKDPKTGQEIYGAFRESGTRAMDLEVYGAGRNSAGIRAVREVRRQLKAEFPNIKTIDATRISGARHGGQTVNVYEGTYMTNRFMRPTRGKRTATPDVEEKAPTRRIGGVNLDNIEGVKDIEYLLEEAQARSGGPTSSVPRGQTVLSGKALGLTPTKAMKNKYDETGLAARIDAGAQLLVNQLGRIQSLLDKSVTQGDAGSARTHVRIAKEMATLSAIYGRVSGNNSEVGRALNILNRVRDVTKSADDLLKYMQSSGNKVYSDPNMLTQLSKMMKDRLDAGDTAGAAKLARASFKPKAEDYIFRLWFNMMLSSPATHAANFLGTGGNFIMDLMENTGAAVIGQGKRFSNADRIRGREVAYRVWGALRALTTADTWSKSRESLNTGLTGNMPNRKTGETESNVYTGDNPALGFMSGIVEAPTRALAGADEWWRNVLQMSNMYGLAVRNAGNKGLKGSEFWDEVDNLVANPTKEMIEATNDYTKVIQFLDKPSGIAETIINAQTPKPNSRIPGRIARGTLKFFVPFVRTPDALIRTAIRRSGPLGALERENIEGWKKGGAERDKVVARMYMGSALAFWVATQAYSGAITGAGPSDYDKKMEWLGTHQENSIKVGDEYVSISGLEPVSTNLTAIATLVERYKQGELSDDDYGKSAIAAAQGLAAVLTENSYLQGIQDLVTISSTDPGKAQSGLTNFLAGLASSMTTPAILRKQVQVNDPAIRDTTGDGSFTDRVKGRVMSGAPGLSDELPQRYDVYGRPMERDIAGPDMLTRQNTKEVEKDPAVLELQRLAETTDKVVVGPPSKSNIKVDGVARRLTAEEFQDYQQLSGYWIVETVRQEMDTPEWETMTDAEKLEVIGDIKKDMRANAREYLFNSAEEETEDE